MKKLLDLNPKLNFNEVLITPLASDINSRNDINLINTYKLPISGINWTGTPIIASNMDYIGTLDMAKSLQEKKVLTALTKFHQQSDLINALTTNIDMNYVLPTFGMDTTKNIMNFISKIIIASQVETLIIVFDIANGYIKNFHKLIKAIRKEMPKLGIFAGNIVTGEGVKLLANAGVDAVKIGIGSGSVCTTSSITGIGYPQLSAILDCSETIKKEGILSISDGGIKVIGDIAKAYVAGADFVMIGGLLAGHTQGNAPTIKKDNILFRKYYGMSSQEAMELHYETIPKYRTAEGTSKLIKDKGDVSPTIDAILGGLRSACSYVNAKSIQELSQNGKFIRITP